MTTFTAIQYNIDHDMLQLTLRMLDYSEHE